MVWAKSSSKVPQEFTFCPNRHRKHGASGGQRFGESSDFPGYWKPPTPSGGIWLAATMSLTLVRCWVKVLILTPAGGRLGRLDWLRTRFVGPDGI